MSSPVVLSSGWPMMAWHRPEPLPHGTDAEITCFHAPVRDETGSQARNPPPTLVCSMSTMPWPADEWSLTSTAEMGVADGMIEVADDAADVQILPSRHR